MLKRILTPLALFTLLSTITLQAHAVAPGFYLGLMAGPATNDAKNQDVIACNDTCITTGTPSSKKNFGGRVFLGYKFIQYAAVESGFSLYSPIRYRVTTAGNGSSTPVAWFGTIDFSGKGSLPFYGFEVYGRLGAAINNITKSSAFDTNSPGNPKKSNVWTFGPLYGVGANYALTQNWVVDLAATRTNISDVVGKITSYTIGFSYHFVDVYCGQFLC